jgi:tRNA (guanine9-N1)-methyltransferase
MADSIATENSSPLTASSSGTGVADIAAPLLSKNAKKKAAKAERLAEMKLKKRQLEKEKKKEKKRIREQKRAAGELDENELREEEERAKKKAKLAGPKQPFNARVVVDLGFDDMMNEKVWYTISSCKVS